MSEQREMLKKRVHDVVSRAIGAHYFKAWFWVRNDPVGLPYVMCIFQPSENAKIMYNPDFTFEEDRLLAQSFKRFREAADEDGSGEWTHVTIIIGTDRTMQFEFGYEVLNPADHSRRLDEWIGHYVPGLKPKGLWRRKS